MGSAFYAETQIWPKLAEEEAVMFAWGQNDLLLHRPQRLCAIEWPHAADTCLFFQQAKASAGRPA